MISGRAYGSGHVNFSWEIPPLQLIPAEDAEQIAPGPRRSWVGWVPMAVLPCAAIATRSILPPWGFMWVLAFSLYLALKWVTWWRARTHVQHAAWRSFVYLVAWPGMDAGSVLNGSDRLPPPSGRNWIRAFSNTTLGVVLLWVVARAVPIGLPLLRGWIGMLGLILMLHFGAFEILSLCWQSLGVDAQPIMSSPLRATSLSQFWGRRWNLGFRQLAHDLIFRPTQRILGVGLASFLVFVASGLIHDLVISAPARAGYGLPTGYFVLQGIGVAIERSAVGKQLALRHGPRGWMFMAVFTAAPAFWLFHPSFVRSVMLPFMQAIRAL
jgi:hypothetical protein